MATKDVSVTCLFIRVRRSTSQPGWFEARTVNGWPNDPDYRDDFPLAYGRTEGMARALALKLCTDLLLSEAKDLLSDELAAAARSA